MKTMIAMFLLFIGTSMMYPLIAQEPPMPPPDGMRRAHGPRGKRDFHKEFFARLTPEERAELDRLAKANDRKAFQQKMRELFRKYPPADEVKIRQLSSRYLAEKDPAAKEKIKKEMEQEIRIQFEKRMEFTKNNIRHTEEQLKKAQERLDRYKARYEENRTNAEKFIQFRLEQMCLPEKDRKMPPPPPEPHGRMTPRPAGR